MLSNKYNLLTKIGTGSFADVYIALRMSDHKQVATKIELKKHNESSRLLHEYEIYKELCQSRYKSSFPSIYDLIQTPKYNIMTMQLLGDSLNDMYTKHKKFQLSTVFAIGIQIINLLEKMHQIGYIHRDIKPNNFLLGRKRIDKIFITDFGLSRKYVDENGQHIPPKKSPTFVGTVRYASINIHHGIDASRRDDLESVGYMLVFFLKGFLPWQGKGKDKTKDEMIKIIGDIKINTSSTLLCDGLPNCFHQYITYCRTLKYDEEPSYEYLRNIIFKTMAQLNISPKLEWC